MKSFEFQSVSVKDAPILNFFTDNDNRLFRMIFADTDSLIFLEGKKKNLVMAYLQVTALKWFTARAVYQYS